MPRGFRQTTAAVADIRGLEGFAGTVGAPGYAVLERENDAGGRFTLWNSRDSHGPCHSSAGTTTPCGSTVAERAARAGSGATPLAEGSVRRSGECVFTPSPPPPGLLPNQRSLAGRPSERALNDPRATFCATVVERP